MPGFIFKFVKKTNMTKIVTRWGQGEWDGAWNKMCHEQDLYERGGK